MTDQTPNPAFWIVLDKRGNPGVPYTSRRMAELKCEEWDIRFDQLAPHRIVLYRPVSGEENANANPAVPEKTA